MKTGWMRDGNLLKHGFIQFLFIFCSKIIEANSGVDVYSPVQSEAAVTSGETAEVGSKSQLSEDSCESETGSRCSPDVIFAFEFIPWILQYLRDLGACSTVLKWKKTLNLPKPVTELLGINPHIIKHLQQMPEKVSSNLSRTFHWRKRHWNRLFAKDEVISADLLDTPRPIEENKTGHPSWQENEVVLVDIWGEFLDSGCLQSLVIWIHLSIFWRILAITQKLGTCHVWNTLLDTFGYPLGVPIHKMNSAEPILTSKISHQATEKDTVNHCMWSEWDVSKMYSTYYPSSNNRSVKNGWTGVYLQYEFPFIFQVIFHFHPWLCQEGPQPTSACPSFFPCAKNQFQEAKRSRKTCRPSSSLPRAGVTDVPPCQQLPFPAAPGSYAAERRGKRTAIKREGKWTPMTHDLLMTCFFSKWMFHVTFLIAAEFFLFFFHILLVLCLCNFIKCHSSGGAGLPTGPSW